MGKPTPKAMRKAFSNGNTYPEGDDLMTMWTSDELTKIGTAEELQIAAQRGDGTL